MDVSVNSSEKNLDGISSTAVVTTVECPFCAEQIAVKAKKCRHCHETVDVAMRKAEEALRASERQNGNVYMNAAVSTPAHAHPIQGQKSRVGAVVLALLLGGLGLHKFYLGRVGWGILYLVFCWTFIPSFIAFIEGVIYACTSEEKFAAKYG